MKDEYMIADMQRQIDLMDNIAYDQHCNLEIALDALNQIVDIPNVAATDARAVKDMVKVATWALGIIQDGKIAEPST